MSNRVKTGQISQELRVVQAKEKIQAEIPNFYSEMQIIFAPKKKSIV